MLSLKHKCTWSRRVKWQFAWSSLNSEACKDCPNYWWFGLWWLVVWFPGNNPNYHPTQTTDQSSADSARHHWVMRLGAQIRYLSPLLRWHYPNRWESQRQALNAVCVLHVENISCLLFVLEPSKVSQNRNLTKRNRKKECNESGRFKIVCESMFEWMQMHLPAHLYWNELYAVNLCPDVDCPSPFHSIPKWLQSSCAHIEKKQISQFSFSLGRKGP